MRRTIYAHPSLFLVIGLLVLWQIVFWLVGRDALLPPLETILYLAGLLQTARFWGHICACSRRCACTGGCACAGVP